MTIAVKRLPLNIWTWPDDKYTLRNAVARLVADGGVECFICGTRLTSTFDVQVDHDHDDGAVRGLLCRDCNMGLGCFRDRPELLVAAWGYLQSEPGDVSEAFDKERADADAE